MRHLCLSMEKPLLAEFKIYNLIIRRITSKKPQNSPLSSLKFCSHCRSSQKYLPAADTCFMNPEMGAAPTKLIQENFFQKQLVIVILLVLWCSCTQANWCLCQNCSKASQYYQGWCRKTEAVRQQDVKHVLKRDSLFGSLWKMRLPEAVLDPHKCTSVPRVTCGCIRCIYIYKIKKKKKWH